MKLAVGLALAALATSASLAAAPGRMDLGKRAVRVSTDEKAVLPDNKALEQNEVLMDKRFESGTGMKTKESAVVGDRRSTITVGDDRDKKLFSTPDRKEYDVIERKESAWSGKESRYSTADDAYRSKVATRFQDKIGDASPITGEVTTTVSRRTTFDRINRFVFRKNGDQRVRVNSAGDEGSGTDISERSSVSISEPKVSAQTDPAP